MSRKNIAIAKPLMLPSPRGDKLYLRADIYKWDNTLPSPCGDKLCFAWQHIVEQSQRFSSPRGDVLCRKNGTIPFLRSRRGFVQTCQTSIAYPKEKGNHMPVYPPKSGANRTKNVRSAPFLLQLRTLPDDPIAEIIDVDTPF